MISFRFYKKFFFLVGELYSFFKTPRRDRRIVFYSEGGEYWSHFEPIYRALYKKYSERVIYVTSNDNDPNFNNPPPGLKTYYIGEGSVRTIFFATLDVDVLVMTMPDMNSFHIKRSPFSVKYVYVQHSLVSTHMIYRPQAFDYFDIIFCSGPHHIIEIKTRERNNKLNQKCLVQHGYGRLDKIINLNKNLSLKTKKSSIKSVLIAPSWGVNGLLEVHGLVLIENLLKCGLRTIVRPHPMTFLKNPKLFDLLQKYFGKNPNYSLDLDIDSIKSLLDADIMISDWSGVALEFSFGLQKPLIFVDTPKKINNKKYHELDIIPLEVLIRKKIGVVIPQEKINKIGSNMSEISKDANILCRNGLKERKKWVYNLGKSGEVAADYLYSLL